ncbi:hypothetical protein KIN20_015061, partial [Parelaphostrongylus tenuis]
MRISYREISGGCIDFRTIGLNMFNGDIEEVVKIVKNWDRLLQHPLCTDIVEVDRRTFKFSPSPPALLKPLIERIRRGYAISAEHEGRDDVANEEERCMHEDVTKMKVACNFLLELIDRQRVLEQKNH